MTIQEVEQQIKEEFDTFTDWMQRYEYIIDLGKEAPKLESEAMIEENLVPGCQSRVWLVATHKDGNVYFQADSDALIVRGLISLLIRILDGRTKEEIQNYEPTFLQDIGLTQHLSPARTNGLMAMIKKMKELS